MKKNHKKPDNRRSSDDTLSYRMWLRRNGRQKYGFYQIYREIRTGIYPDSQWQCYPRKIERQASRQDHSQRLWND